MKNRRRLNIQFGKRVYKNKAKEDGYCHLHKENKEIPVLKELTISREASASLLYMNFKKPKVENYICSDKE